jgi:protein-tyrosine phosphatase
MAEAMLRQRLQARGVPARVHSAGLVLENDPAHPHAQEVLLGEGIDLSGHRSRIIDADLLAAADLIVAMEQRHVREVAVVEPAALARAFTLPDLVRRGEAIGPRTHQPFADWLAEAGAGRKRLDLLRRDVGIEVPDPMGGSKRAFRRTHDTLADLLDRLVDLAWPPGALTGHDEVAAPSSTPTHRST